MLLNIKIVTTIQLGKLPVQWIRQGGGFFKKPHIGQKGKCRTLLSYSGGGIV
jgi:hypothetical protein